MPEWRLPVDEPRRVAAVLQLAEPGETAGRRALKTRTKSDRTAAAIAASSGSRRCEAAAST
jgi:hypothetical protein